MKKKTYTEEERIQRRREYYRKPKITKKCLYCGKEFITANKKKIYCCRKHCTRYFYENKTVKVKKKCKYCEKEFVGNSKIKKFCSRKCGEKYRHVTSKAGLPILQSCKYCGKEIIQNTMRNTKYCNRICSGRYRHLEKAYGMNKEDFDNLIESQNNLCCICGEDMLDKPHIDHDHVTGKVRGALCHYCNHALGSFRDNVVYLENAIKYLNQS